MRHLLCILLLAAALATAGCTGGDFGSAGTPASENVYKTIQVSLTPVVIAAEAGTQATFVVRSPVPTVTQPPAQDGYVTYTNSEFHFAIQHPASWTASGEYVTTPGQGTKYVVTFTDPAMRSKQYISITPGSQGLSLDDWAHIFQEQVTNNPEVSVAGQEPVQLDGAPARKLVLTYGSGAYATQSLIIMTIRGDNAYFLEFTSRKEDFAAYSGDAGQITGTFRFT